MDRHRHSHSQLPRPHSWRQHNKSKGLSRSATHCTLESESPESNGQKAGPLLVLDNRRPTSCLCFVHRPVTLDKYPDSRIYLVAASRSASRAEKGRRGGSSIPQIERRGIRSEIDKSSIPSHHILSFIESPSTRTALSKRHYNASRKIIRSTFDGKSDLANVQPVPLPTRPVFPTTLGPLQLEPHVRPQQLDRKPSRARSIRSSAFAPRLKEDRGRR
jgi:hypothetical protein